MAIKKISIPSASEPYDIGAKLENIEGATDLQAIQALATASSSSAGYLHHEDDGSWTLAAGGGGGGGVNITVSASEPATSQEGDFWYKVL